MVVRWKSYSIKLAMKLIRQTQTATYLKTNKTYTFRAGVDHGTPVHSCNKIKSLSMIRISAASTMTTSTSRSQLACKAWKQGSSLGWQVLTFELMWYCLHCKVQMRCTVYQQSTNTSFTRLVNNIWSSAQAYTNRASMNFKPYLHTYLLTRLINNLLMRRRSPVIKTVWSSIKTKVSQRPYLSYLCIWSIQWPQTTISSLLASFWKWRRRMTSGLMMRRKKLWLFQMSSLRALVF